MLIVCPNCATSYNVEPASLGAAGRSVRCVRCKQTWFASNPEAMAAIARTHHAEVVDFASGTSVRDFTGMQPEPAAAPEPALVEAAPLIAPEDAPAEAQPEFVRDDRGPAPLPERTDYQLPSQPEPPVVDAVAEPVPDHEAGAAAAARAAPEDIESVAARRMRRNAARRKSKSSWIPVTVLTMIALNISLMAWRAEIVRFLPQTASLYAAIGLPVNLRGLEFIDIVTRKEQQDGVQMLVVEGFIKSHAKRKADVPRLRFAVRNAAGHEIYSWTAQPARNSIPSGATLPFRSRLASPPPEAHEVLVRFFTRRDLVAGLQ